MRQTFSLACGCALIALVVSPGCGRLRVQDAEARDDGLIVSGDWGRLADAMQAKQTRSPKDPPLAFLAWEASWRFGDVEEAVKAEHVLVGTRRATRPDLRPVARWADGLTRRNQGSAAAWQLAADAHRMAWEADEATNAAIEAVRLAPKDWASWAVRGMAEKDQAAAVKDFTRGLSLKPDAEYLYVLRVAAYWELHEIDRGAADAQQAIRLAPRDPWPHQYLQQFYMARSQLGKALAEAGRSIELDPDGDGAYTKRSFTYWALGDFKAALRDANKVVELLPWDFQGYRCRAQVLYNLGDWDGAIKDATHAIDLTDSDAPAYRTRGAAYLGKGDLTRATGDLTRSIELAPTDGRAYCTRALVYARLGRRGEAEQDLRQAARLTPEGTKRVIEQERSTFEAAHVSLPLQAPTSRAK